MIQLTYNQAIMRPEDLREVCMNNLYKRIDHRDNNDYFIFSVSEMITYTPMDKDAAHPEERIGFIIKLRTTFGSEYKVVISHLVSFTKKGDLCLNNRLSEFISLTQIVESKNVNTNFGQTLSTIKDFTDHLFLSPTKSAYRS